MDKGLLFVDFLLVLFVLHAVEARVLTTIDESVDDDDEESSSWSRCPFIRNKLKNGRVKLRSRGRIAKFMCDPGYDLAGKRFTTCVRGQWNNPVPVCVSRGCSRPPVVNNARVSEMYRGAVLLYECLPGYSMQGGATVYCDGRHWSSDAPLCEVSTTNPEKSCDFEDPDLCGWSHDPTHEFDWKRNQFATPSGHVGTGPTSDHTFGPGKGGFYLYMEASSPRKVNDTARLFSPVYANVNSGGCFVFWYHMFGSTTGGLRVYVKPESHVFGELLPTWAEYGDQGNRWIRGNVTVPPFSENFQIVIEGIRGSGYIGDTAIDDVSLNSEDCSVIGNFTDQKTEFVSTSCRGRCREANDSYPCGCNDDCVASGPGTPCCEDFSELCTKRPDGTENPEEYSASVTTPKPAKEETSPNPETSTSIQTVTSHISTYPSIVPVSFRATIIEETSSASTIPASTPTTLTFSASTTPTPTLMTTKSPSTTATLSSTSSIPYTTSTTPSTSSNYISTILTTPSITSTKPSTTSTAPITTSATPSTILTTLFISSATPTTIPISTSTNSATSSTTLTTISKPLTTPTTASSTSYTKSTTSYTKSTTPYMKSTTSNTKSTTPYAKSTTSYTKSTTPYAKSTTSYTKSTTSYTKPTTLFTKSTLSSTASTQSSATSTGSSKTSAIPFTITIMPLKTSTITQNPALPVIYFTTTIKPFTTSITSPTKFTTFSSMFYRPSTTGVKSSTSTVSTKVTPLILTSTVMTTSTAPSSSIHTTNKLTVPSYRNTVSTKSTARYTTISPVTVEETRRTYNLRPRYRTTPLPTRRIYYRTTTQGYWVLITKSVTRLPYTRFPTSQASSTAITTPTTSLITSTELSSSTVFTSTSKTVPKPTDRTSVSKEAKQSSTAASTASHSGLSTVTVVSVLLISAACIAGGLLLYFRRWKARRQAKLADDSEMRFLYENEFIEFSDASALEKMNSNHPLI